jgi:hypothetical protein
MLTRTKYPKEYHKRIQKHLVCSFCETLYKSKVYKDCRYCEMSKTFVTGNQSTCEKFKLARYAYCPTMHHFVTPAQCVERQSNKGVKECTEKCQIGRGVRQVLGR